MMARWQHLVILILLLLPNHGKAEESCIKAMRADVNEPYELDLSDAEIRWKGQVLWHKKRRDFAINRYFLNLLAQNENVVFSAEQIFGMAFPDDETTGSEERKIFVRNLYVRIKRMFLKADARFYQLNYDQEYQGYVWCDDDPRSPPDLKIDHLVMISGEIFWKEQVMPELALSPNGLANKHRQLLSMLIRQPDTAFGPAEVAARIWPKTQFASAQDAADAMRKLANLLRKPFKRVDAEFAKVHLYDGRLSWNRRPPQTKMHFSFRGSDFTLTPRSGFLLLTILRYSKPYVSKEFFDNLLARRQPGKRSISLASLFANLRKELAEQGIPADRIKRPRRYGARWTGAVKPQYISKEFRSP